MFMLEQNLFYNSFIPSMIRAWNDLSEEIKNVSSVVSFKYRLNNNFIKPSQYYDSGYRIGQILHARVQMEYSFLNTHLYRKNIIPSQT